MSPLSQGWFETVVSVLTTDLYKVERFRERYTRVVVCHHNLSRTTCQGTLEDGQQRDRQRNCWMDNIKEWTSLSMPEQLTRASRRKDWNGIPAEWSTGPPDDPLGQGTEMK